MMGLTATVATFKSSVQEPSNVTAGAKPDVDTVGRERLGPSSRGGFPRRSRTQEVGECPIELVIKKQEDAREPFPPQGSQGLVRNGCQLCSHVRGSQGPQSGPFGMRLSAFGLTWPKNHRPQPLRSCGGGRR